MGHAPAFSQLLHAHALKRVGCEADGLTYDLVTRVDAKFFTASDKKNMHAKRLNGVRRAMGRRTVTAWVLIRLGGHAPAVARLH